MITRFFFNYKKPLIYIIIKAILPIMKIKKFFKPLTSAFLLACNISASEASPEVTPTEKLKGPHSSSTDKLEDLAHNIGDTDYRRPVKLNEERYAPFGIVLGAGGVCSSVVTDFLGYTALDRTTIATAAHCVKLDNNGLTFGIEYEDNGRTYGALGDWESHWVHPFYKDFQKGYVSGQMLENFNSRQYDFAISIIDEDKLQPMGLKKGVTLAALPKGVFHPIEELMTMKGVKADAAGYSADVSSLYTHENCEITYQYKTYLESNCQSSQGASGGGIQYSEFKNGRPHFFAVDTAVSGDSTYSVHTGISRVFLDTVPFLKNQYTLKGKLCEAVVIANNNGPSGSLNMRYAPHNGGLNLRGEFGEAFQIPSGEAVKIFNTGASFDGDWALAEYKDRIGFVSQDYLKMVSNSCPQHVY